LRGAVGRPGCVDGCVAGLAAGVLLAAVVAVGRAGAAVAGRLVRPSVAPRLGFVGSGRVGSAGRLMPWCEACSRYWNPTSMNPDGSCPTCGSVIAEPSGRAAWHFKLVLLALVRA